ncbi:disease resistance protein RPM1 [Amborella trichopoda]|nr:disease resistance protein RPM1 [Amborella trichopoda]|eukprot:XP_006836665.2 disease resistance protein RPM1 [Amborella trichopoda]
MAGRVVSFFLQKLDTLLTEEVRLLSGVHEDIVWLRDELGTMQAFLEDAERRKSRDLLVRTWVVQVKEVVYFAEDILDEFMIQMECLGQFSVKKLIIRHRVGSKIQDIKARIRAITDRRTTYDIQRRDDEAATLFRAKDPLVTAPFIAEADIVGLQEDVEILVGWLLNGRPKLEMISLVGMGGIGKTTLAKKVFQMGKTKSHFDRRSWVTLSQSFTIAGLVKSMLKGFYKNVNEETATIDTMDEGQLYMCLYSFLQEKRFLLVLDDVWSEDVWNGLSIFLLDCKPGSRIVLTTRKRNVASSIQVRSHIHHLRPLTREEAWSLFCKKAIRKFDYKRITPEMEKVWRIIVSRCQGVPRGIVSKRQIEIAQWMEVLQTLQWELANNPSLKRVRGILSMSYNDLPTHLIHCFLDCCLFPKDYVIRKSKQIKLWVGEGFVEQLPRETGKLIHLRFLGLRNTGIRKLPKSLQNLRRLETLDAIGSNLKSLPHWISHLQNLNHLLVRKIMPLDVEGVIELLKSDKGIYYKQFVRINFDVGSLAHLRTLQFVGVKGKAIKHLGELSQLEKLHFLIQNKADGQKLWAAIQNMRNLQNLVILTKTKPIVIESMDSPPPRLSKLQLHVILRKLPKWLCSLESLTRLVLRSSALSEDPLVALQTLPNLTKLMLSKAYYGRFMGGDGIVGFPKLEHLVLHNLKNLCWWGGMKEGCMPMLRTLTIIGCKNLVELDDSFQNLTSLQCLILGNMAKDFVEALQPKERGYYKVKHIPEIRILTLIRGALFYKNLRAY